MCCIDVIWCSVSSYWQYWYFNRSSPYLQHGSMLTSIDKDEAKQQLRPRVSSVGATRYKPRVRTAIDVRKPNGFISCPPPSIRTNACGSCILPVYCLSLIVQAALLRSEMAYGSLPMKQSCSSFPLRPIRMPHACVLNVTNATYLTWFRCNTDGLIPRSRCTAVIKASTGSLQPSAARIPRGCPLLTSS